MWEYIAKVREQLAGTGVGLNIGLHTRPSRCLTRHSATQPLSSSSADKFVLPQICIQGIEENLEWAVDFNAAIFKFYPFKPGVWSSSRIKIATGDRSALSFYCVVIPLGQGRYSVFGERATTPFNIIRFSRNPSLLLKYHPSLCIAEAIQRN